jgi:sulfatase maturation enzyme AslB (radical SAM superfamily)
VNGSRLTDEWVQTLAKYIGGIAVSLYDSKELCYNAVEKLSKAGIVQVNIHKVFHSQNFDDCMQVIDDAATDPRLKEHLKAVMFLTLKPKGKRNKLMPCKDVASYKKLIKHAMSKGVQIGFDSCSAPSFLMSLKDDPDFEKYAGMVESCESNRMSGYVNVEGKWFHCSFTEGEPGWSGIDLMKVTDFMKEVWNSNEVERFRNKLLKQDNSKICGDCYLCPIYSLYDPVIGDASGKIINLEVV